MPNRETLIKMVIDSISAASGIPAAKITVQSSLTNDLKLESIHLLEVIFEIDQRSEKKINFAEILQLSKSRSGQENHDLRVDDLVEYLVRNSAK